MVAKQRVVLGAIFAECNQFGGGLLLTVPPDMAAKAAGISAPFANQYRGASVSGCSHVQQGRVLG